MRVVSFGMDETLFSQIAEDMHAAAAEAEELAKWQDEVNASIADPEPEDFK